MIMQTTEETIKSLTQKLNYLRVQMAGTRALFYQVRDKLNAIESQFDVVSNELYELQQGQFCIGDLRTNGTINEKGV